MSARMFKFPNPLAKALTRTGGLSQKEAVAAAETRLVELRSRTLEEIDRTVLAIQALAQAVTRVDDPRVQEIYGAANRIVALAGVFERSQLGDAAYSLCELVARFRATGRWSSAMVAVHVDALQVMSRIQDHDPDHCRALREGLRKVVDAAAS